MLRHEQSFCKGNKYQGSITSGFKICLLLVLMMNDCMSLLVFFSHYFWSLMTRARWLLILTFRHRPSGLRLCRPMIQVTRDLEAA